jgi:hypothetical protein
MGKVYLSKNKQANPTDIAEAIHYFSQKNEVVQFQGGEYNESILDGCDILCIIPPGQHQIEDKEEWLEIPIGKGNFTEILAYNNRVEEGERKVFVYKNNTLYSAFKVRITEINWANSWAVLALKK